MNYEQKKSCIKNKLPNGMTSIKLPEIKLQKKDSLTLEGLDKGLYTKDLLSAMESPNMGCSIMEMNDSIYDFELGHDEINYVIEGTLQILTEDKRLTIGKGEVCFLPKGSQGCYEAEELVRFLSVSCAYEWE